MPFQMSSAVILDMVQRKSFEERVEHIAYNMAAHEKDLIRDGSTSDFMAYLRSNKFKERQAHFEKEAAKKLKKVITKEDLMGK
jgi:isocitrate dehydrogenase kinase/phosphatase